jgi:hypothetical protein
MRALDDLVDRVVTLADRTIADKASLRLAEVFSDAYLPKQALIVSQSLTRSSDPTVARAALDAVTPWERDMGLPPSGPPSPRGPLPPRPPPPPIGPGDGST